MLIRSKTCGCGQQLAEESNYYIGIERVCSRCYMDYRYQVEVEGEPDSGGVLGWMMVISGVFWVVVAFLIWELS